MEGGVVIECSRLDRILEVNAADRYAVVQPGVLNAALSKAVARHGLFYAPDPSSQLACTIGGNVGENSGGPHTLKYGTTTQHVLALDDNTGCIDLAIDPAEPDILYAAMYQVRRDAFSGGNPETQTGPKSGLYKTTDGGKSWQKMAGGLPNRPIGRCGLNWWEQFGETEIGWTFARDHWGNGYATEAARAVLAWGFGTLGLTRITAMIHHGNTASTTVARRLGFALLREDSVLGRPCTVHALDREGFTAS